MATKQIGKLKLHWSKRGVAFKWGDGEIHRLSFERKRAGEDVQGYDQAYGGYDSQGNYDENQVYDQGYDQGYDAQDDYGEREKADYGVLYQNDWVMYALLVVFPPLGIWLLWKRRPFTQLIRGIISALSAAWFILLLVWLFTWLFGSIGGQGDRVLQSDANPYIVETLPPVSTIAPAATPAASVTPAPTPIGTIPSGTSGGTNNANSGNSGTGGSSGIEYVYASTTGGFYHTTETCSNIKAGENVSRVELSFANEKGLEPCSVCANGSSDNGGTETTLYYIKSGNKYYHKAATCGRVTGLTAATKAEAQRQNKKPCPTCIGNVYATAGGKYYHKTATCSGMSGAKLITEAYAKSNGKTACPTCLPKKASTSTTTGTKYYATPKGKYYHTDKTCGGMKGATVTTSALVKKRKQTACPVCVGKSSTSTTSGNYYATKAGKFYHTKSNCSGMKNAVKVTLAVAKKNGKTACPTCVKPASTAVYYATSAGKYYHKNATCSGMKGAKKITKATAEKNGKTACPTCLKANATIVYGTSSGKFYHKNATCSGMKGAKKMSLASAKTSGKTACPVCYKSEAAKTIYYYATKAGKYYHRTASCSGMKNATKVTLKTAISNGKQPCPTCLNSKTQYYYATKSGKYYHVKSNCSGIKNASKVTLAAAQKAGKTACPTCLKKNQVLPTATPAPKVLCYASSGSRYYHKDKACSGLKNLKKVALSVAKEKGKTACPVCVTKQVKKTNLTTSHADKQTVAYASTASVYFHQDKDCVSGLKKTTVAAAKNKGKFACPSCGKNLNTYVYVTRSGTKYHRKSTCSGTVNAYKVSLTTAVKLNYVRCTKCNAPKKK